MSQTGVIIAENTTIYEYPRSKRKIVKDGKGNVIYDSNNDKDKGK
jgi:hypothetical protein